MKVFAVILASVLGTFIAAGARAATAPEPAGHDFVIRGFRFRSGESLPVEIAGRNRLWRQMVIDAITSDPAYPGGEYKAEPSEGLRDAENLLIIAGASPLPMQLQLPTGAAAKAWYHTELPRRLKGLDANDLVYAVASSRTYDPSKALEKISAPITWVNSADDFINPADLGIAPREAKRLKNGRFVLIPTSPASHGHGSHTWAVLWKDELAALLKRSE